jgi:hypothetical protein
MLGKRYEISQILLFAECWLEISTLPEDPTTGHFDTGFLGFRLSLSKYRDGSQVLSFYCVLLMKPYMTS